VTTAQKLIAEIADSGPITLGRYMDIANRDYYASRNPIGAAGDFVTAPEISQMFGEIIGLWLADIGGRAGQLADAHYVELGPGRGTLASDALRAMARFGWSPPAHLVETSPLLRAEQAKLLSQAQWHDTVESLPDDGPLLIVANEFFDALPIEQIVRAETGWHQQMVVRNRNRFAAALSPQPLSDAGAADAANGTVIEYAPAAQAMMAALSQRLSRQGGALLIIDYGYTQPASGSSLQAIKRQLPVNPFDDPGNADLTAHVNFLDLANSARRHLLHVQGPVEQGQWLTALGIAARAKALARAAPGESAALAAAVHRLTHVDEMGRLFKVMAVIGQGWPSGDGFAYGEGAFGERIDGQGVMVSESKAVADRA
jgi:NADH dehydrogenase [ubiquinone] 1 alpha subcomplex assembly factor 7